MDAALVDPLTAHQLVGWVGREVPKVEMVPQMRKMVTAMILAPRCASMVVNRLIIRLEGLTRVGL